MKMKKILIIPLLMIVLLCGGCWALWFTGGAAVGAGAGVGITAYVNGKLKAHVPQNPVEVATATEQAFKNLDIKQISTTSSKLEAEIVGRNSADDKVKVWADSTEDGGSDLTIRIGWFGDETQSRQIYDEIRKQFPPTTTIPVKK